MIFEAIGSGGGEILVIENGSWVRSAKFCMGKRLASDPSGLGLAGLDESPDDHTKKASRHLLGWLTLATEAWIRISLFRM